MGCGGSTAPCAIRGANDLMKLCHDVIGPKVYDWGRSAYVRDPDGRIVELMQERR